MFYSMYLSSLCERRHWPTPHYSPTSTRAGHYCKVRVNNREYATDVPYMTEPLARDAAATKAFMICRNFSANDGMFPGQRPGAQVVQGLPVAIGSGRKRDSSGSEATTSSGSEGMGSSLGGESPRSIESGFEGQMRLVGAMPKPQQQQGRNQRKSTGGKGHRGPSNAGWMGPARGDEYLCLCRRSGVQAYGRCSFCLRESGWA
nr:hypothetical protein B0A51_09890 [Rachicladosporium sp. CCFEE 5018]